MKRTAAGFGVALALALLLVPAQVVAHGGVIVEGMPQPEEAQPCSGDLERAEHDHLTPFGEPLIQDVHNVDRVCEVMVEVSWEESDGVGVEEYQVLRRRIEPVEDYEVVGSVAPGEGRFVDDVDIVAKTPYLYRIRALGQNHWRDSAEVFYYTINLMTVSRLTGSPLGESVMLQWELPAGRNSLDGYRIYRSGGPGEPFDPLAEVLPHVTAYQDNEVEPQRTYHYALVGFLAFDDGGSRESCFSDTVAATTYPGKKVAAAYYFPSQEAAGPSPASDEVEVGGCSTSGNRSSLALFLLLLPALVLVRRRS